MSAPETVAVGLGEIHVTKNPAAVLVAYGLGSCIGMCAYDPLAGVGGMAHMVLPDSKGDETSSLPAKYVDLGIRTLLEEMKRLGALRSRLSVKAVGGAHVISAPGFDGSFQVGEHNLETMEKVLAREGIRLSAADVGGNTGRTFQLHVSSGKVVVRRIGQEFREM